MCWLVVREEKKLWIISFLKLCKRRNHCPKLRALLGKRCSMPRGVYVRKGYATDRGAWIKRVIYLLYSRADRQKCFDCRKRARDWDHYLGYAEEVIFAVQPVCRSCHKLREYRRGVPGKMKNK